jgi:hypothetical protein
MWSPRWEHQNSENAACGGCDDAERFSCTEGGNAHGGSYGFCGCGDLGALVCNGDKYAVDDFIVGVVDHAHDNSADLVNHPRLSADDPRLHAAATLHGDAADNRRNDASPIATVHYDAGDNRPTAGFAAAAAHIDHRSVTMSEDRRASPALPKWIGIMGLFIAPTTIITSLCYFYGYVATRTYFSYFGIDTDAIGFTTTDYVMKSAPALYVPLVVGLLTWVAMLWVGDYLRRLLQCGHRPRLLRRLASVAMAVGAVGVARAIVGLTKPDWAPIHVDAVTPVALGLGAALLVVGFWMLAGTRAADAPQPFAAAERGTLIVAAAAIMVALFWVTDVFATFRGHDLANNTNAGLWSRETVVVVDVDARQDLPLLLANQIKVSWAPLGSDPTAKSTFLRYECFRALAVHNDRWVLVPARWAPAGGFAVIVTADSSHVISLKRIEHIADSDAAKNKAGNWECPEVGIDAQSK